MAVSNPNGANDSRLKIIGELPPKRYDYGSYKMVLCRCECGKEISARLSHVVGGHTKSCGCLQAETVIKRNFRHGKAKHPLYTVWLGMKERCNNPNAHNYKWYGGRGIKIEKRWHGFINFYNDVVAGYRGGLTLDRINNQLGYGSDNFRWATMKEQANNRG